MTINLSRYNGQLTPEQVAKGLTMASENAARLASDAELLFDQGRFPSAASLAVLAIEEAGKIAILRGLALESTQEGLKRHWKDFRSHKHKNVMWIFPDMVKSGARKLDDFRPIVDSDSDHQLILENIKQIGIYTDCYGAAHWSSPEEVIDKNLAKGLVQIASVLCKSRIYTTDEVDLWIKHMQPVWKGPYDWMKKALVEWHKEMVARGLLDDQPDKMEEFVLGVGFNIYKQDPKS